LSHIPHENTKIYTILPEGFEPGTCQQVVPSHTHYRCPHTHIQLLLHIILLPVVHHLVIFVKTNALRSCGTRTSFPLSLQHQVK